MSSKNSRHTPSPSSTSPPPSKLPRFLQKPTNRDRSNSKSLTDPGQVGTPGSSSLTSGSSASSPESQVSSKPRKSKFLSINKDREEKARKSSDTPPPDSTTLSHNAEMDEPPVIVEPVTIPRPRTRSERPLNSAPETHHHIPTLYSSASSTSRIGDLPTRLSGWFSHTFSTSSTDLSLPSLLAQQGSPKGKGPSALLTAAKHGKGHLDKAMRYLLDSDATPDKCTDPIWLLGVQHPGYEPPLPPLPDVIASPTAHRRGSGSPPSFRSSTSSIASSSADISLSQSQNSSKQKQDPSAHWPPVFYIDFTSRIWLTYRSQFPTPIKDGRLADLCSDNWEAAASSPTTVKTRPWNWGAEKTWSSDSGWGCMLRTGQSLLANALIHVHLGRDWRRPPHPVPTADYATYVQILTWFLDTPSPESPFSVHRMALAGKEFGTDVGQWFGPSVAAGAIRTLVSNFEASGLSVAVAVDSSLYQTQVFAASHGDANSRSPRRQHTKTWGDRPVLLLLGIRLGIEGVNPIYYETIKLLYQFPQSVGIAGGRPSSSYYFVGSQADNLFYLDPHNTRPAIPLRHPPPPGGPGEDEREASPEPDQDGSKLRHPQPRVGSPNSTQHHRAPTSPSSTRTGSSNFSYHAPVSPSPLQHQFSNSSADSSSSYTHSRSPPPSYHGQHGRWRSASHSQPGSPRMTPSEMDHRELGVYGPAPVESDSPNFNSRDSGLEPLQMHYCTAYSAAELKTFHCDRVRKMPLSGLDPSMLIGFLCRDEADWWDFRKRVGELPRTIFSVQDEAPTWPSDSDDNMGLESISEPDDMDFDEEGAEVDGDGDNEPFFDSNSGSVSSASNSQAGRSERGRSEDVDTEEDPLGPMTPGPNSRFDLVHPSTKKGKARKEDDEDDSDEDQGVDFRPEDGDGFDDDIEDDWIDPSLPTPTPSGPSPAFETPQPPAAPVKEPSPSPPSSSNVPPLAKGKSSSSKHSSSSGSGRSKSKKTSKQIPVPVPAVKLPSSQEHYPFPVASADDGSSTPYQDRSRTSSTKGGGTGGKRMHTARARDGGRTQSGGVKGIMTDD